MGKGKPFFFIVLLGIKAQVSCQRRIKIDYLRRKMAASQHTQCASKTRPSSLQATLHWYITSLINRLGDVNNAEA